MSGPGPPLTLWDPASADSSENAWRLRDLPMIGRYELIYELGRGSNGVVYEAFDTHLDRYVALKLFNEKTTRDQAHAEATALRQVLHPNVLTLHDLCFEAEQAYLIAGIVHGGTLRERAKASGGWRETLGWCIQAAHGLEAIHAKGIVHNDIKPANILVDHSGHTQVIDLGLSARAGEFHRGGTPSYLAPERHASGIGTPHSDQYSLARAIVWSLLSGDDVHDVPLRLWLMLHLAMSRDPDERFASVRDFAAALEQVRSQNPLRAIGGHDG